MEKEIKNRFEKVENRLENIENFIESGLSKKGHFVTCHRCNHSWLCKSSSRFVSCTSCGTKTRNINSTKKETKETKKKDLYVKGKGWEEQAKKAGIV